MNAFSVFLGQILALFIVAGVVLLYLKTRKPKAAEPEAPPEPVPVDDVYWEGNWKYIGGKFTQINIADYRAVYCFKYYPKGKYSKLSKADDAHREMILAFKNGDHYKAVELVSDFLRGNFWKSVLRHWVFCVIPAAEADKNEKRYKDFCAEVARETGIADGYEVVSRVSNRLDSRNGKNEDTLSGLRIDPSLIQGKSVLLFDDITTRGTSFIQLADNLRSAGADKVVGFFLGKTVFD